MKMESDHTPEAFSPPTIQGDTNLTQPSAGEQPTSVESRLKEEIGHYALVWMAAPPTVPDTIKEVVALDHAAIIAANFCEEERRQAKIEALEDLLLAEDIGQGDVSTWNKVIRSRITTLRGENNE